MHRAVRANWGAALLTLCGLLSACADAHSRLEALGGETHFLRCERDGDCAVLGAEIECGDQGLCEDPRTGDPVVPDEGCPRDDCAPAASGAPSTVGGGEVAVSAVAAPLVMLVVDTSGSMERLPGCSCETPGCEECLPSCGSGADQRNRWARTLEALTGRIGEFECTTLDRTEANGMSYDEGYYLPYHRPGGRGKIEDGVMDAYATRVRFGLATFDGWDTYVGSPPLVPAEDFDEAASLGTDGLWSYDPRSVAPSLYEQNLGAPGGFFYPGCASPYRMDTGIRSALADEGALRVAHDAGDALRINAAIQADLERVRPYGGTPIASALHDLNFYFRSDPAAASERERPSAERHVVLLTDGYPDDDYRSFGCNCREEQDPTDPGYCGGSGNDPAMMHCPYPTAEEVARALRCGDGAACDDGIVARVHVIGLSIDDDEVVGRLNAIAEQGGTAGARFVDGATSPRDALVDVLEAILR